MTEQEWLACEEPVRMLSVFRRNVTNRKLRLFGVACCRTFWDELRIDVTRATIEVTERYADGQATEEELRRARNVAHAEAWAAHYYTRRPPHGTDSVERRNYFRERLGNPTDHTLARLYLVAFMANNDHRLRSDEMSLLRTDPVLARLGPSLFRELLGNPFRPVTFSQAWRTDTAMSLAHQMYELQDFPAAPILADALQDAGCDSDALLNHLRDMNAAHVRGCWALDLVLGKE